MTNDGPFAAIPVTVTRERQRDFEEKGIWTLESIGWMSELAAERWPDREFLIAGDDRFTYLEFNRWVRIVAGDLVKRGVQSRDRVMVQLTNCVEAIVFQVAAFRIGAVAVPVLPIYREHEVRQIIRSSTPSVIVGQARYRDRAPTGEIDAILAELALPVKAKFSVGEPVDGWEIPPQRDASQGRISLPSPAAADECALILFTSGTTSAPKGALLSSRAMLASARLWRLWLDLTTEDVALTCAPVSHIAGFLDAFLIPASIGGKAVLLTSWDPDVAVELVERERATFTNGAPVFLSDIVDRYEAEGEPRGHRLRIFIAGGAGVSPQLIERADTVGICAFRNYGMTECAGSTTITRLQAPLERRAEWDGILVEGSELEIVGEDDQVLPPGEVGRVRLRGPQLMSAYTDAAATAAQLSDEGWFYPGDVGMVDDHGWFKCVGRTKDIVNRGGEKFSTSDIEEAISRHPSIHRVAVAGVPDERLGERVAAFVSLRDGYEWRGPDELIDFLHDARLAKQKIPVEWHHLREVPMTASGKIRKLELIRIREESAEVGVS